MWIINADVDRSLSTHENVKACVGSLMPFSFLPLNDKHLAYVYVDDRNKKWFWLSCEDRCFTASSLRVHGPYVQTGKLRLKEVLPWPSLSWCPLTRSKQSFLFLRRYVKHRVSGFTCFLFGGLCGQALLPRRLVSVSRSQHQSLQRRAADGGRGANTGLPLLLPMNCVTTDKLFTDIDHLVASCYSLLNNDLLPLVQTFVNMIYCKSWWRKAPYRSRVI